MSFSEEILKNKLDALEDTQDSIVTTSQWVLFHYRYADRAAAEWDRYLKITTSVNKKLSLIYLANEVVQQSRARKRVEFIEAFQKVLPNALSEAYKQVTDPIKKKIVKTVNIWGQRKIFPKPIRLDTITDGNDTASGGKRSDSANNSTVQDLDQKIRLIGKSSQKFHAYYHELLLAAKGIFQEDDKTRLITLINTLDANLLQLEDLKKTVSKELDAIDQRAKNTELKKIEAVTKQKEIEENQRQELQKLLKDQKRAEEEENLLPTYEDSDSGSDSEEHSEVDNQEGGTGEKDATITKESEESEKSDSEPALKKLRFADDVESS